MHCRLTHIFSSQRIQLPVRAPLLWSWLLAGLLWLVFLPGEKHLAAKPEDYRTDCLAPACGILELTTACPAATNSKTFSLPWIEKDDLQEHEQRREGENDCLYNPAGAEWLLSRKILLSTSSVPKLYTNIYLNNYQIRAGPLS